MIFGDVNSIEIEVFSRDFHRFIDIESHTAKSILDLLSDYRDRMDASTLMCEGKCCIHPFFLEAFRDRVALDRLTRTIKCSSDGITQFIGAFSDGSFFFRRKIFESFEDLCQFTILSKDSVFIERECFFCLDGREGMDDTGFEFLEEGEHDLDFEWHDKVSVAIFSFVFWES